MGRKSLKCPLGKDGTGHTTNKALVGVRGPVTWDHFVQYCAAKGYDIDDYPNDTTSICIPCHSQVKALQMKDRGSNKIVQPTAQAGAVEPTETRSKRVNPIDIRDFQMRIRVCSWSSKKCLPFLYAQN